ncbi:hypothetical protein [Paenarthrobacter histidinolovorans]|uniref:hypothetical protein n=1 Tax=Paenarthrobacter histidinolovorans TaxID=43664 RepID=UPI001665CA84
MSFAVQDRIQDRAHLTDLNEELVNAWIAVRAHQDELRPLLAWYKDHDSKQFYYEVRSEIPEGSGAGKTVLLAGAEDLGINNEDCHIRNSRLIIWPDRQAYCLRKMS